MHHALLIQEILLNIFGHCHPADPSCTVERSQSTADLAALARTCRAFKEPALDVLWSELIDLSPLAFSLPNRHRSSSNCCSFTSPRNDVEWGTLRSYTRRVWRIVSFSSPSGQLDPGCVSATFHASFVDPLFPNLRFLRWESGTTTLPVVHFAAPSLASLDIRGIPQEDVSAYMTLLDTLAPRCPNIRKVRIHVADNAVFSETVYRHLCSWNKLQVVDCLDVAMPANVVPHLASITTLMWLSFTLYTPSPNLIPPLGSPLVFSQLVYLEIISESLESVTDLVAHTRLPAVQVLIVPFPRRPFKTAVKSYLSTLCAICSSTSLTDLRLLHLRSATRHHTPTPSDRSVRPPECRLEFDDLAPCMVFNHLRALHVNLEWSVDLGDDDVRALVSAWPHLEHLVINDRWGWRTPRGITLDGLVHVLHQCPHVWELCVALDTEGVRHGARPLDVDWSARKPLRLNVADARIRSEDVAALSAVLGSFRMSERFVAWNGPEMGDIPGATEFRYLWRRMFL